MEARSFNAFRMTYAVQLSIPALLILATVLLLWAVWPVTVLELRAGPGGPLLKSIPVSTGERVVYSYVHSIQRTRIDETLEVGRDGHMIVREALYDMTGYGLPSDILDGEFSIDPETKKFHITNMSRDIPEWRARIGTMSETSLEVRGEVIRLDTVAPPMTSLVIGPATRSRFSW